MASVLIIYATTGGNTELVADKVTYVLSQKSHQVTSVKVERLNSSLIKKHKYIVFASSTYSEGLLEDDMIIFFLKNKDISLKGKKCASIGLGDNKYNVEYVVEAANLLSEKIKKLGGEEIIPPLRINKSPVPYLKTTIKDWAEKLSKVIK